MKKIMMNKYGFERWPEEDFSDDGHRFTCYKVGSRVRVSKLVTGNKAYISACIDGTKLPYEVYSKLPHYKDLDKLNGIHCMLITDDDLTKLFEDCVMYEHEYTAAENAIKLPTMLELEAQCCFIRNNLCRQIIDAECAIKNNIVKLMSNLSDYQWKTLKAYYNNLVEELKRVDTYPERLFNTAQSISFCKPNSSYLQDSFYYKEIIKLTK